MKETRQTVVVALGGNAILQPGQLGTFEEQLVNVDQSCRRIARLVADGWRVVLTHGNGPQVGNILIQNAWPPSSSAPMPMDVCGAETQGRSATCCSRACTTTSSGCASRCPSPPS